VETQLQTHALLIKDILEPCSAEWLASSVFPSKESTCCKVENTLQKLLALSEKDVLPSYNSMEDLVAKWQEEVLGKTVESIDFHTKEKKESLIVRLKYMRNLLRDLQDRNVLHDEHGKNIIDKSKTVPLQIILGRLANFFPMISLFRRVADHLCPELHRILSMNPNDLCKDLNVLHLLKRGEKSRNRVESALNATR
jgi:hypothetical protein